jgi:thiol-disulfide isomerase/thioredoxin
MRLHRHLGRVAGLVLLAVVTAPPLARAQVVGVNADEAALRIRYEKGARVVLFYSATCPASRQMFPAFKVLARQYAPLGVSILAYSLNDDPELLDRYLGREQLPFERTYIYPGETGSLASALRSEGIRVPKGTSYTPSIVVMDDAGGMVGQHAGTRVRDLRTAGSGKSATNRTSALPIVQRPAELTPARRL